MNRKYGSCKSNDEVSLSKKLRGSPFWLILFSKEFAYISVQDKTGNFIFGTQNRLDTSHRKITPRGKMSVTLGWLRELPKIVGFPFITFTKAEARNLKFGAHYKKTPKEKSGRGPRLGELLTFLEFPYIFFATAEASNFEYGIQLKFIKAHLKTHPK